MKPAFRIKSVKYGMYSPDEIQNISVVEVTDQAIRKKHIVSQHGVNDFRMGVTRTNITCTTCGMDVMRCMGHVGHIDLVHAIQNVDCLQYIHKILSSVCFYCSGLLLSKENSVFFKSPQMTLLKHLNNIAKESVLKKACTCILPSGETCGGIQPTFTLRDFYISATLTTTQLHDIKSHTELPFFNAEKTFQILDNISISTCNLIGIDVRMMRPSSMVWKNFLVPPCIIRPSKSKGNDKKINGEDDLTLRLRDIVKENNKLRKITEQLQCGIRLNFMQYITPEGEILDENKLTETYLKLEGVPSIPTEDYSKAYNVYQKLLKLVATYQNHKYQKKVGENEYILDRDSVFCRFIRNTAKKGRLRYTIFGKRQNFSARSVISPSTSIDIDEIGVPKRICMTLIYPELVNLRNIHYLTKLVRNGPEVYPGAISIKNTFGEFMLFHKKRDAIRLRVGWVVNRHLKNGDLVLVNRQPSLHKHSLMAHRVVVSNTQTILLHIAVTKAYNADFDGDEMNLQVLMSEKTRAEGSELMSVKKNICKDSKPIICFHQNSILAVYLLSKKNTFLTREEISIMDATKKFDTYPISGIDFLSSFLPDDFFVFYKKLHIERGQIKVYQINGDLLNNGIVATMWHDYGYERTNEYINRMYKALEAFLQIAGTSISPRDCWRSSIKSLQMNIDKTKQYVNQFPTHKPNGKAYLETNIVKLNNKLRDIYGARVMQSIQNNKSPNGLFDIIKSKTKGNPTNIVQISGMVGQQYNHHATRITCQTNHSTQKNVNKSFGMIYSSFSNGLDNVEYYNHLAGSRVGLVDTAIKTSDTGYSQRRISKAMEDIHIDAFGNAVDISGTIVQFKYGCDGLDPNQIQPNKLILNSNINEYLHTSNLQSNDYLINTEEVEYLQQIKKELLESFNEVICNTLCYAPFSLKRLLARAQEIKDPSDKITTTDCFTGFQKVWAYTVTQKLIPEYHIKMKFLLFEFFSSYRIVFVHHLTQKQFQYLIDSILNSLFKAQINQGESVGIVSAQHSVEPLTQMTLNTFHKSGQFSTLVDGVSRMKEILNVVTKKPSECNLQLFLKKKPTEEDLQMLNKIIMINVRDLVIGWKFFTHTETDDTYLPFKVYEEKKETTLKIIFKVSRKNCIKFQVSLQALVDFIISVPLKKYKIPLKNVSYSTYDDSPTWWVCIFLSKMDKCYLNIKSKIQKQYQISDPSDKFIVMSIFKEVINDNRTLRGQNNINDFYIEQRSCVIPDKDTKQIKYVAMFSGTNLQKMLELFPQSVVISDSLTETFELLGIDACMCSLEYEWSKVMQANEAHISQRHIKLIVAAMTYRGFPCPMTYTGICKHRDVPTIKKAGFEKIMDSFLSGVLTGQHDQNVGYSSAVCWNSQIRRGSYSVNLFNEPTEIPRNMFSQNIQHVSYNYKVQPLNLQEKFSNQQSKWETYCKKFNETTFTPNNNGLFLPYSP